MLTPPAAQQAATPSQKTRLLVGGRVYSEAKSSVWEHGEDLDNRRGLVGAALFIANSSQSAKTPVRDIGYLIPYGMG